MVWFFSKKQTVSKEEFQCLIETIKNSFSNIKTDVSKIKEKTLTNQEQIKDLRNTLGYLNESIKTMNNRIEHISFRQARQNRRIEEEESIQEDLTEQEQLTYSETKSTKKKFIKKIRKRRQVFIELTDRGNSLSQTTPNSQIKVSREKRNVSNK